MGIFIWRGYWPYLVAGVNFGGGLDNIDGRDNVDGDPDGNIDDCYFDEDETVDGSILFTPAMIFTRVWIVMHI
jgi:hypothetical protein